MKYLIFALLLVGCAPPNPTADKTLEPGTMPHGVLKFRDGPVTCYVFYTHGISCVSSQDRKEPQ